jgi:PKD repeat protein
MKKNLLFLALIPSWMAFGQNTCNTAQVVTAGSYVISTIDGTQVPDPVCASGGGGATAGEWFKYVPTANFTVTVTTDLAVNPAIDNRVHIYNGSCAALNCIAGDDDSGTGFLCVVTFQVLAGNDYFIAFDNKWSSAGFTFELQETPAVVIDPSYVDFTAQYIPTISGSYKIAVADMNGDYLDDIVSLTETNIQIHYQNASGTFNAVNYTTQTAQFMPSWSMAIADYNKDGYNDLLYGGGNGVSFMKSNGLGTGFTHHATSNYVFAQRSNFIDLNNDGNLDAFVCHDVAPNVYYMNDGSGNLTFNQGGIGDHPNGGNYGSIWIDYNNDGLSDLFIAKCRGGENTAKINELHRNNGDGTFTNVSVASNLADPVQTWSSAWNDFDNDGDMDVVIGASSFSDGNHKVMRNNGDGTFTDITAGTGWDVFAGLSIEYVSYDFNNDGYADVFTNGYIMYNNGDFTFTPRATPMNVAAIGDLNNDGFLDVQVGNNVYFSSGNSNNWVKLNLNGVESNKNGIGARVEVYGDWGKQIRDVQAGIGFRHMGTLNVQFGIGTATSIDSVIVRWPSGTVDVICNPTINANLYVQEGTGSVPQAHFTVSDNEVFTGETVVATDASTICPNQWNWTVAPSNGWTFVNGTTSTSQHPEILFSEAGTYTVSLIATNSNGSSVNVIEEEILVTSGLSLQEINTNMIKIYPNPTGSTLNLSVSAGIDVNEMKIVSAIGNVVRTMNHSNQIDVSDLKSGTYFLEVRSVSNDLVRVRFVKQ